MTRIASREALAQPAVLEELVLRIVDVALRISSREAFTCPFRQLRLMAAASVLDGSLGAKAEAQVSTRLYQAVVAWSNGLHRWGKPLVHPT